jgi:hypothetical protein
MLRWLIVYLHRNMSLYGYPNHLKDKNRGYSITHKTDFEEGTKSGRRPLQAGADPGVAKGAPPILFANWPCNFGIWKINISN